MRVLALLLALLTLPIPVSANWIRKLDVFSTEDVASMPDGRVLALSQGDLVVVDAEGNAHAAVGLPSPGPTIWTKVAAGPGGEAVIVSGGDGNISVMKLTSGLKVSWNRKYTPFTGYPIVDVTVAADGDIVVFGSQRSRALILRLRPDGQVRWASLYDQPLTDRFLDAVPLPDSGLILAGVGSSQPWLIRVAADGSVAWQRRWAVADAAGSLHAIERMHDGNFLAVGRAQRDLFVVKVDEHGRDIWTKQGPETFSVNDLVTLRNGTYLIVASHTNVPLTTIDADGQIVWQRGMSTAPQDMAAARTTDGLIVWPHLGEPLRTMMHLGFDGSSNCGLMPPASVPLRAATVPNAPLTVERSTIQVESVVVSSETAARTITSSEVPCPDTPRAPAAISAPAPAFAGFAPRQESWNRQVDLYLKKDFARLDEEAERLRSLKSAGNPMEWHLQLFYRALRAAGETLGHQEAVARAEEWVRARPTSPTARIVLSRALYDVAWQRRGAGDIASTTGSGMSEYREGMKRAQRAHDEAREIAERDPQWHVLAVRLAEEMGGDGREIARAAARTSHYPPLFETAAWYQSERWGGRPGSFRAWAEESAALSKQTFKDAMYAQIAFFALSALEREEWDRIGFAPARVRLACNDLISLAPEWTPSHHVCARLARAFEDRKTLRELFNRPELAWFEGADDIWKLRQNHDEARMFASTTPAVAPQPSVTSTKSATAGVAPAPADVPVKSAAPGVKKWPQLVMQTELTFRFEEPQKTSAFLVQTPSGLKAVSAVTVQPVNDAYNIVNAAKEKLVSWTMRSPLQPKRILTVASIETVSKNAYQAGVALPLLPFKGDPPVEPLQISEAEPISGPVFIIACRWEGDICKQFAMTAEIGSASGTYFYLFPTSSWDANQLAGAAVLDDAGRVLGVVNGQSSGSRMGVASIDAERISGVLTSSSR